MATIIIDGQSLQSPNWHRGMGKYSVELLRAMSAEGYFEKRRVVVLLTSQIELEVERKEALDEIIPEAEWQSLNLHLAPEDHRDIEMAQNHNRGVLDAFVRRESLEGVPFFMLSLFDSTTMAVFPSDTANILIKYDLIPYLYSDLYLTAEETRRPYYLRWRDVFDAHTILTISDTTRSDLVNFLHLQPERLTNIDGAAIMREGLERTRPKCIAEDDGFILFPSGDDIRKNNERTIAGFAAYKKATGSKEKLVITSTFRPERQAELSAMHPDVVFSGNVSDAELQWMYENCSKVLFAPEYEGLGLPVLEAVHFGKPVVCSDISIFNEISEKAFIYCRFDESDDIARALNDAVSFKPDKADYEDIQKRYSWQATAKRAIRAIDATKRPKESQKPRLAIMMPHPEGYSGIGKYVQTQLAYLHDAFECTFFYDTSPVHQRIRDDYMTYFVDVRHARSLTPEDAEKYDGVLYHIGNSDYHHDIYQTAVAIPGIAVLHDTYLGGLFRTLVDENRISKDRYDAEIIVGKKPELKEDPGEFITTIVNQSKHVIVHSKFNKDVVAKTPRYEGKKPKVSATILATSSPVEKRRTKHGSKFRVGSAGIIAGAKGIDEFLDLARTFKDVANFEIFGMSIDGFSDQDEMRRKIAAAKVKLHKNESDFRYQRLLKSMDIVINYRSTYRGETSMTVLEAMRYGCILVVRNVGWYAELPDDAVVKVDHPDEIEKELEALLKHPTRMAKMSQAAIEYVKKHHSHALYIEAVKKCLS